MAFKLKHYSIKETSPNNASWILIDAEGETLGRLSTNIAMILMGKNKPNYINKTNFDFVVISPGINIKKCYLKNFLKKNFKKIVTDLDIFV